MKRSARHQILTTHVGSLPDVSAAHTDQTSLVNAIAEAVRRQKAIGISIINEGEETKGGDWLRYIETRLSGFEAEPEGPTIINQGRDREEFNDYYRQLEAAPADAANDSSAAARAPKLGLCRAAPICWPGRHGACNPGLQSELEGRRGSFLDDDGASEL